MKLFQFAAAALTMALVANQANAIALEVEDDTKEARMTVLLEKPLGKMGVPLTKAEENELMKYCKELTEDECGARMDALELREIKRR